MSDDHPEDREESIRRRAYELWEQGGGDHGRHEDHWHQASGEVGGDTGTPLAPDGTTIGDVSEAVDKGEGASIVDAEAATPVEAPAKPAAKAPPKPRKPKTTK